MVNLRAKFSQERLIAIGFLAMLVLVFVVSLFWLRFAATAEASLRMVSHTYDVMGRIQAVIATVSDAEAGVRGFVITGRDAFLDPYRRAIELLDHELEQLQQATRDNPRQQSNLQRLIPVITEKRVRSERIISQRRELGFWAARAEVSTAEGKQLMDEIRDVISDMSAEERRLLDERRAQEVRSSAHATAGVAALAFTMMLLLGFLAYAIKFALRARSAALAQLEQIAHHDPLTELANRRHLESVLRRTMELARRKQRQAAVIFFDLDGFKQVNDELGHKAGDDLLVAVARRLKDNVRLSDVVARLGGDEFVVVLPEIETLVEIERVAEKLIDALAKPYDLAGREMTITSSAGIARFPGDAATLEVLLENADQALYAAKAAGKNRFSLFRHHADHTGKSNKK